MKMEIDLTDEQAQKVELLKENGIEVGDAIDMFFEMKDTVVESTNQILDARIERVNEEKAMLQKQLDQLDQDLSFFNKIKDTALDSAQKQKIVEKEYGIVNKTYDENLQDAKHKVKWSKFFKF